MGIKLYTVGTVLPPVTARVAHRLDRPAVRASIDTKGLHEQLCTFRPQWQSGVQAAGALSTHSPLPTGLDSISVSGMGASSVHAEVMKDLLSAVDFPLPVLINRTDSMPSYINSRSLVLTCSYGGNIGETLAAVEEAVRRNIPTIAFTSGGRLMEKAADLGIPVVALPGRLVSVSTLPLYLGSILSTLDILKILSPSVLLHADPVLESVQTYVDDLGQRPARENPAKQLALFLRGRVPYFVSAEGLTSGLGTYWAAQINELAKIAALHSPVPNFAHVDIHLIGSLGHSSSDLRRFRFVFLRHDEESPLVRSRMERVQTLLDRRGIGFAEICGIEKGWEDILKGSALAGFAAYYLAILRGVGPARHGLEIDLR